MDPIGSRSLSLPALRMQALEAGPAAGPLVLLLHGFPELSESWRDVLPVLAQAGFHAVAPDLRGYGGTDRPRHGYDLDTLAEDIRQLTVHLQPGRPAHVVGHDWGGAIAYHLAAMHPEAVDRLAVVNAPHPSVMAKHIWRPAQLKRSWYMFYFQLPVLPERRISANGGAVIPFVIRRNLVDKDRVPMEKLQAYAKNLATPEAARAALAYYRSAIRGVLTPSGLRRLLRGYPRIRAPFRLIWGEEDAALRRELTLGMEPYFEQPVEVRYLPGVGHFAPLEAPGKVAALLLEHLRPGEPAATGAGRPP
jgi:pimeloyl-ACP methyl ester carboxylesterase